MRSTLSSLAILLAFALTACGGEPTGESGSEANEPERSEERSEQAENAPAPSSKRSADSYLAEIEGAASLVAASEEAGSREDVTKWVRHLRSLFNEIKYESELSERQREELLKRISDAGGTPPEEIPDPPKADLTPPEQG